MSGPIGLMLADDVAPVSSGPKFVEGNCGMKKVSRRHIDPKCPADLEG